MSWPIRVACGISANYNRLSMSALEEDDSGLVYKTSLSFKEKQLVLESSSWVNEIYRVWRVLRIELT